MKRNRQLYPLSHQHHNGLMAVLLVRKGLTNQKPVTVINDFISQFVTNELLPHFEAEEKWLQLLSTDSQYQQLYQQMVSEHQQLQQLAAQLQEAPETKLLVDFCRLLEQHIRFEERKLFEYLQQYLPGSEMDALGKRLAMLPPAGCLDYPVKFWEP